MAPFWDLLRKQSPFTCHTIWTTKRRTNSEDWIFVQLPRDHSVSYKSKVNLVSQQIPPWEANSETHRHLKSLVTEGLENLQKKGTVVLKPWKKHQELNRGLWGWGFSVLQLQKKVVLPSFMSLCRLQKGEHSQYSNACLVISFQEGHHKITSDLSITGEVTHIWEEEKEMEQQSTNILVLNPCFILKSVRSSWSSSQERKAIHQIQVTNIACSVHSLHVPVCHLQTVWKVCCKHWEDSEERNRNTEKEEARQTQANSHSSIPFHYF